MLKWFKKYREIITYLIAGGLTTFVNLVVYFFLNNVAHLHYLLANFTAIVVSIIFAFFINKFFVFRQSDTSFKVILKEFILFCSFRALSGLIDMVLLSVFVSWINIDSNIAKLLTQVAVVILNYIFSKFFVFKRRK